MLLASPEGCFPSIVPYCQPAVSLAPLRNGVALPPSAEKACPHPTQAAIAAISG
jgi:hypothetical protein